MVLQKFNLDYILKLYNRYMYENYSILVNSICMRWPCIGSVPSVPKITFRYRVLVCPGIKQVEKHQYRDRNRLQLYPFLFFYVLFVIISLDGSTTNLSSVTFLIDRLVTQVEKTSLCLWVSIVKFTAFKKFYYKYSSKFYDNYTCM